MYRQGLWGIIVLAPLLGSIASGGAGYGLLASGLILALMIMPIMSATIRDVLLAFPQDQIEASLALGSTQWQAIARVALPAVRTAIEDDGLMDEALVEHAGAKELIAQLRSADPDDDLYDAKVTVLGEQIGHHVEEEESDMFPRAKGSGIDTMSLGAALLKRNAELSSSSSTPSMTRPAAKK